MEVHRGLWYDIGGDIFYVRWHAKRTMSSQWFPIDCAARVGWTPESLHVYPPHKLFPGAIASCEALLKAISGQLDVMLSFNITFCAILMFFGLQFFWLSLHWTTTRTQYQYFLPKLCQNTYQSVGHHAEFQHTFCHSDVCSSRLFVQRHWLAQLLIHLATVGGPMLKSMPQIAFVSLSCFVRFCLSTTVETLVKH